MAKIYNDLSEAEKLQFTQTFFERSSSIGLSNVKLIETETLFTVGSTQELPSMAEGLDLTHDHTIYATASCKDWQ